MRKFAILSMIMLLGAPSVLASSLSVPFWRDTGNNLDGNAPTTGFAGFIGIKNNVADAGMLVIVEYITTPGGGDVVQETTSTFALGPNGAVSWRPVASDAEGAGSNVDNVTSGALAGGAKITFIRDDGAPTGASDVQGRYVEIGSNGASFAYLLPPGV